MATSEIDEPDVDELAVEFLERHRDGESPSIEEYARRHPELADEIRELFPTILKLEGLKHHLSDSSSGHAGVGLPGLSRLGDFRIIRELARGGMGVVYEAEQESLRRRVALKVLGANIASSPKLLARFRREAEAAARLHHTNIVPVFGVGEEHGVYFYAMQYIEGPPLSAIISELRKSTGPRTISQLVEQCGAGRLRRSDESSVAETLADPSSGAQEAPLLARIEGAGTNGARRVVVSQDREPHSPPEAPPEPAFFIDFRVAARMAADLADALHYAHLHGVLHRDVKPSNVLVDREGIVWITDFGLAKQDESGDLTRTGDVIGTLRYMAPEQLHGQTDVRSDVYSLGLTLYELLAGQPAFDDSLKASLIQRKTEQPPRPLRSVNRRIPRDLETIVQKACAPLPADRYQTALEFAEDLHRFIEEQPIRARRLPVLARMWRWTRRNPVIASLTLLAAILFIAVGVAVGIGNYNTNQALNNALTERQRAELNLNGAVAALQEITRDIASRGLPQSLQISTEEGEEAVLQFTPVTAADAELLKKLLSFFDEFAASNEKDLTAETAQIRVYIGEIRHRLGQFEESETAYRDAINTYQALHADEPGNLDVTIALAETLNSIGTVQADRGQVRQAMLSHNAAREAIESAPVAMASDQGQYTLARTFTLYHQRYGRAGFTDMWGPGPGPGLGNRRRRGDGPRRSVEDRADPDGQDVAGDDSANEQREDAEQRTGEERGNVRDGDRNGGPRTDRDGRSDRQRAWDEQRQQVQEHFPKESINRAIDLLEGLVARNPDEAEYQLSLAQAYRVQMVRGYWDREDSSAPAAHALEILSDLKEQFPNDPRYLYELADTLCTSVRRQRDLDPDEESARVVRARQICELLTHRYPHEPSYLALAAVADRRLASIDRKSGRLEDAESRCEEAAETYRGLTERFPSVSLYFIGRAQTLSELAETLREAGEQDRALEESTEAVRVAESCQRLRGYDDQFFGGFLWRLRRQRDGLARAASFPRSQRADRDL